MNVTLDTLDKVMSAEQIELAKGKIDLMKVIALANAINMCFHEQSASDDRKLYRAYQAAHMSQVRVVAEGYVNYVRYVTLIIGAGLAAGGANDLSKLAELGAQISGDSNSYAQEKNRAELHSYEKLRDSADQDSREQIRQSFSNIDAALKARQMMYNFIVNMQAH